MSHEMFLGEDFFDRADNVYEAIIAISRRSRQIGEEQRKEMDAYLGQVERLEKFHEDDDSYNQPVRPHEPVIQFEKPTVLALREMIADKIEIIRPGQDKKEEASDPMSAFKLDLNESEDDSAAPMSFGSKLDLSGEDDDSSEGSAEGGFPSKLSLDE